MTRQEKALHTIRERIERSKIKDWHVMNLHMLILEDIERALTQDTHINADESMTHQIDASLERS